MYLIKMNGEPKGKKACVKTALKTENVSLKVD